MVQGTSRQAIQRGLQRREWALLGAALGLLALAVCAPSLAADVHQHGFADQRTLWGLPHAVDVLSNLPFAVAALWGAVLLGRLGRRESLATEGTTRALAALFFTGLLLTTAGSAAYHWQPDNAGLLWDRLGMVAAFSGLLGLGAAARVSPRAGMATAGFMLVAAPAAALWWAHSGNLMPWAVAQLGGMLVVLVLAFLPKRAGALALNRGGVVAWYGAAKLCELWDANVFAFTGYWVSGHSLKHLLAAGAALPVLLALHRAVQKQRSNDAPQRPASMQNGAPAGTWSLAKRTRTAATQMGPRRSV